MKKSKKEKYSCPFCGKKFGIRAMHGHIMFGHPEEYEKIGYPKIKANMLGIPIITPDLPKEYTEEKKDVKTKKDTEPKKDKEPPKEEIESVSEMTGDETKRDEVVQIEWDEDKPLEMMTHRTLPSKAMKLDPRIDFVFSYLKSNGLIPYEWKMGDFMNHYVLEHLRMKDGLNPSIIKTFGGNPNNREMIMMDDNFKDINKEKTPEEIIKEFQKNELANLQMKKLMNELKDTGEKSGMDAGYIEQVSKLVDKLTAQKMAMSIVGSLFNDDGGKKSSEVDALKEQLRQMAEDKKLSEMKTAMERLSDSVKNQRQGKDAGTKDMITMMLGMNKQQSDFKDALHSKDTEIMRQSLENSQKMLAEKLQSIADKTSNPNVVQQLQSLRDTRDAFKNFGLMKGEEKSSGEIIKELVGNTAQALSPALNTFAQGYASQMQTQQQPPTPEEMARIQQIQQQTEGQPKVEQPQLIPESIPSPEPKLNIKPEEDERVFENLTSLEFGGDGTGGYVNKKSRK